MARLLIHPGEHLADELKALGMSANEFAKELGVPTNRLTQIIQGKRGISGDTALRLGRWFGTSHSCPLVRMDCPMMRCRLNRFGVNPTSQETTSSGCHGFCSH
jgi:addiction module HigA family antidote